jgi:hypothetical protein
MTTGQQGMNGLPGEERKSFGPVLQVYKRLKINVGGHSSAS